MPLASGVGRADRDSDSQWKAPLSSGTADQPLHSPSAGLSAGLSAPYPPCSDEHRRPPNPQELYTIVVTLEVSLRRVCQGTRETLMVLRHAFRLVDQRAPATHVDPTLAASP